MTNPTPKVHQEFLDTWTDPARRQASIAAYTGGQQSFIPNLLPALAVQLSAEETLAILRARFGALVDAALNPANANPNTPPVNMPYQLRGPVAGQPDGGWLKRTNMVGVNVRTVGSFWNLVKYALTLPAAQDSIHILPIWEAGVAGSMYGMSSWNLNPEFYSDELVDAAPALNSIDQQLRAVVNLLHVMGKAVGMDVIPHTDRFSQIALAFPEYFEWLQRQDTAIVDHRANLHEAAQQRITEFLREHGPAVADEPLPDNPFDPAVDEERRMRLLFGRPDDLDGRETRRNLIIRQLYRYGLEPAPGTMAPPFRGLAVDTRPEAGNVDAHGQVWRDFIITRPEPMSRVFGPLGRYKLYDSLNDNTDWQLDFLRPRMAVWDYVCRKYYQMQQRYNFDFMRGDMSHVQMRPHGVPPQPDDTYDILGAVKNYVRAQGVSWFGYFAETFLAPRDVMGYGEEIDHLEAAEADTTLGDLQSTVVGTPEFLQRFRSYYDMLETRRCVPNFTLMTADKDDPRFDEFYVGGSEARMFIALFLTQMPTYMALGFETRDVHFAPAPNEHYTKLYVFQETGGPKATHGPYVWGRNGHLFSAITRLRRYADAIWPALRGRPVRWLLPPDACAFRKVIAWTQADAPEFLFIVNTNFHQPSGSFGLPVPSGVEAAAPPLLDGEFSTASAGIPPVDEVLTFNGKHYPVASLAPGEGRVYRF